MVPKGSVNGRRSDGEDPTTGICRKHPEKEQALRRKTGETGQVRTGGRICKKRRRQPFRIGHSWARLNE